MAYIFGTPSSETLTGTPRSDFIYGYGGNDWIDGRSGNDWIWGGSGSDTFYFGDNSGTPDRIMDFSHSTGNMDILRFGDDIDWYYVAQVPEGVRIVTASDSGQVKQGSIILEGVSAAQWASWHGPTGWHQESISGLIEFGPWSPPKPQAAISDIGLGAGASGFGHEGTNGFHVQPFAPDSSGVFGVAEGQLHENPFTHMHAHGLLLV